MENQRTARQSGLELLRIICILLVIAHHYSVHGGYGDFSCSTLSGKAIFVQAASMFGRMACSVFALISGYFLIKSQKDFAGHVKKIIPLIAEMLFYSLVILVVVAAFGLAPITPKKIVKAVFPLFWDNWFVSYYIILYLLIPFINPFLKSLERKRFLAFIVLLTIIWSIVPTFAINSWSFSNLDFFVAFYAIGAYIRLYGTASDKRKKYVWRTVICASLMVLSVVFFDAAGMLLKKDILIEHATYFREFSSVLAVPCAIFLFLSFKDLELHSSAVNSVASHVLGIYLLHDNQFLRDIIWKKISPNYLFVDSPYIVIHLFVKVAAVFAVCLLIDDIREKTAGKLFNRWLNKNYDSIACRFKSKADKLLDRMCSNNR